MIIGNYFCCFVVKDANCYYIEQAEKNQPLCLLGLMNLLLLMKHFTLFQVGRRFPYASSPPLNSFFEVLQVDPPVQILTLYSLQSLNC